MVMHDGHMPKATAQPALLASSPYHVAGKFNTAFKGKPHEKGGGLRISLSSTWIQCAHAYCHCHDDIAVLVKCYYNANTMANQQILFSKVFPCVTHILKSNALNHENAQAQ